MSKTTKMLFASAILLAFALSTSVVSAKAKYGMAGCGPGSVLIGPAGGKMQVIAATTNASSYAQLFGITLGTSNCVENSYSYNKMQQEVFVSVNFKSLEQEMAAGKGQKLNALASLMGCPATQVNTFGKMAQKSHTEIYSTNDMTPSEFIASVKTEISKNSALATSCKI